MSKSSNALVELLTYPYARIVYFGVSGVYYGQTRSLLSVVCLSYDPVGLPSFQYWTTYPTTQWCAPPTTQWTTSPMMGVHPSKQGRISGHPPSYKSFPSYQHHTMDHSLNKKHHPDPTPSTNHTPPSNDYMTILLPSESNPRPNGGLSLLPGSGLSLLPGSGLPLTHQPTLSTKWRPTTPPSGTPRPTA